MDQITNETEAAAKAPAPKHKEKIERQILDLQRESAHIDGLIEKLGEKRRRALMENAPLEAIKAIERDADESRIDQERIGIKIEALRLQLDDAEREDARERIAAIEQEAAEALEKIGSLRESVDRHIDALDEEGRDMFGRMDALSRLADEAAYLAEAHGLKGANIGTADAVNFKKLADTCAFLRGNYEFYNFGGAPGRFPSARLPSEWKGKSEELRRERRERQRKMNALRERERSANMTLSVTVESKN